MTVTPTIEQATAYQAAYDYFNDCLFEGSLPQCLLNFSRDSRKGVMAFYAPKRWESADGLDVLDEISLSPKSLKRTLEEVFGSLVHEMVHHQQYTYGSPSRRSYHNVQWGQMMLAIGLQPDNGRGGTTGQRVSHKIIEGGRFQEAYQKMDDSLALPWRVFVEGDKDEEPKSKKVKTKYSCSSCGSNVWGKPEMLIRCGICEDFPLYLPV